MIPGLNSNLKHEDRMFHIQTEDSGPKYGHVISHLFHKGTILATVKKDYKKLLETHEGDSLTQEVLKLMRASHRQMVRRLISGDYDEALGIGVAAAPEADLTQTSASDDDSGQETHQDDGPEPTPASEPPEASVGQAASDDDPHEDISDVPLAEVLAMVDEAVDNFGAVSGLPQVDEVAEYFDRRLRHAPTPPDLKACITQWFEAHS